MWLRKLLKIIFAILYRLFAIVHTYGLENIPEKGGAILASNHLGILDAPLIFLKVPRKDLTALVAKKHQKNLLLRWVVNGARGIWINRDEADSQAVRAARDHLQNGGLLGIAPEGTRSKTGTLIEGKTGVAFMADKAQVPIIPIGITGTHNGIKQLISFHRPRITISFGKPFMLPPIDRKNRDASLRKNTDEIMCQIAALLPTDFRGIYSDHPRLGELLEDSPKTRIVA